MKNYIKRATVILSLVMAMSVPVNVHAEDTAVNRLKKVCILRLQVKQKIFTQTRIYTMLLSLCMTAKPWPYIISILSRHLPAYLKAKILQ